jgi:hypothetical protein
MAVESNSRYGDEFRLSGGVSLSQARVILSNFCLNHLGEDGQYLADVIDFCVDARQLQEVLNTLREEVRTHFPDYLPALIAFVREINDTAKEPPAAPATVPSPAPPPPGPKRVNPDAPIASTPAPPVRMAVRSRGGAQPQPLRVANADPLWLENGVSLAHARFTLSEFCLNQFGARAHQLVDAIDRCADVAGLQRVVNLIGADVQARHRDSLPKLIDCVREINETSD